MGLLKGILLIDSNHFVVDMTWGCMNESPKTKPPAAFLAEAVVKMGCPIGTLH